MVDGEVSMVQGEVESFLKLGTVSTWTGLRSGTVLRKERFSGV